MVKITLLLCIYFVNLTNCLQQRCHSEIYATLPYIVEHAVWRNWNQALIFTSDLKSGNENNIERKSIYNFDR